MQHQISGKSIWEARGKSLPAVSSASCCSNSCHLGVPLSFWPTYEWGRGDSASSISASAREGQGRKQRSTDGALRPARISDWQYRRMPEFMAPFLLVTWSAPDHPQVHFSDMCFVYNLYITNWLLVISQLSWWSSCAFTICDFVSLTTCLQPMAPQPPAQPHRPKPSDFSPREH